uniref:Uncharacterized protein n=1 Tax=Rhizophora mucronata TaxID=61149 RepID=A0A2P2MHB3_RHIMU
MKSGFFSTGYVRVLLRCFSRTCGCTIICGPVVQPDATPVDW